MSDKLITVHLPDELYARVQEAAEASHRSLENVLLDSLTVLFGTTTGLDDVDAALSALPDFSDAELWAVVYRRLPWMQSLRLRELSSKRVQGSLGTNEEKELDSLLARVDGDMLLRSEALVILKQRGYEVSGYFEPSI